MRYFCSDDIKGKLKQMYYTIQQSDIIKKADRMLSSLKLTTCTPLTKQQTKIIKTIWQSLQDNNDSLQFRHPVDWQRMGLIDYPQLVKYPMDLSIINKKLREQRYHIVEEVLDDIQLIWDNCKIYNQQGCWIYDLADKLEKSFKKMVKTFLPMITLPGTPITAPLAATHKIQEQEIKYNDKIKLTDRLKALKPEQLGLVIAKLKEVCPRSFRQQEGDKAQIMIDSIDGPSFKAISTILDSLEQSEDALLKKQKI